MGTPDLHVKTCFIFNDAGRIISTREPQPGRGPLFILVRSSTSCAWAVREDVRDEIARKLDRLAREEPPIVNLRQAPLHAQRYLSLLHKPAMSVSDGPAFEFPDSLVEPSGVVVVEDERLLEPNFRGWVSGEIDAGCGPVLAIVEDRLPVSICFCARRSEVAAEAGVETAQLYRGKGYAARVTTAWAIAIRNSGRIPLYSTSWTNHTSLAVARKLNLVPYASSWSCYE
jgi:GNAT acetyltransferase